jgi:hypothetical protein
MGPNAELPRPISASERAGLTGGRPDPGPGDTASQ